MKLKETVHKKHSIFINCYKCPFSLDLHENVEMLNLDQIYKMLNFANIKDAYTFFLKKHEDHLKN